MKGLLLGVFCFLSVTLYCQNAPNYVSKHFATQDTIVLDSIGINPSFFRVETKDGVKIDTALYMIDFVKGTLIPSQFLKSSTDSIKVDFLKYPSFLSRKAQNIDPKYIVGNNDAINNIYRFNTPNFKTNTNPFKGLQTQGSLVRGIRLGNSQNAVIDSRLDLQIVGDLNENVSIRASLQDANLPTQEGGYSQNLDEFDQIFIELYSKNWRIRAGDIDLENTRSQFGRFTKKIQGISLQGQLQTQQGNNVNAFLSGALVRGIYQTSAFNGQEGNQGPYKLVGANGELFIRIISGSERVYVNGVLLTRGEDQDYIINYNAGEITFNPTVPINALMRIRVEYQVGQQNFTRFLGYGGAGYRSESLEINTYLYTESDIKNQPLQQSLTEDQVGILQQAGDNPDLMTASSARPEVYSENKILYRKETINGIEVFVFSNNPDDTLFQVRFTEVGQGRGNYRIADAGTIARIFEYVPPINGLPQGQFEPIIPLEAPVSLQIAGVMGRYKPSTKTNIDFEVSTSAHDKNTFSTIDDENNTGLAAAFTIAQQLLSTKDSTQIQFIGNFDFIGEQFNPIERIYNIEFARDWNLAQPEGDQTLLTGTWAFTNPKFGFVNYRFKRLQFAETYTGNAHQINGSLRIKKAHLQSTLSSLTSKGSLQNTAFLRTQHKLRVPLKKAWTGGTLLFEENKLTDALTDTLQKNSHRLALTNVFLGIGDSTKVYIKGGVQLRHGDSLQNKQLVRNNQAQSVFLEGRPLINTQSELHAFINYTRFKDPSESNGQNLQTRLNYNQFLAKKQLRLSTLLQLQNGLLPQQEFSYLEVAEGQGIYTWNDYNQDQIQDLEEFEIAEFSDQASYIRVLLPNRTFVKTRESTFNQTVSYRPNPSNSIDSLNPFFRRFYFQASYQIQRKELKEGRQLLANPFNLDAGALGLNLNLRTVLAYNQGKQRHTTQYTFVRTSNNQLNPLGVQGNQLESHQLQYNHLVASQWLLQATSNWNENQTRSESFASRNFKITTISFEPKLSYLIEAQNQISVAYNFKQRENITGEEMLLQQQLQFEANFASKANTLWNANFNWIENNYTGNAFSPVAYQLLEGLQAGTNFTWNAVFQKRLTKFLDVSLNYNGRKSENTPTIHTGNIQVRAFF